MQRTNFTRRVRGLLMMSAVAAVIAGGVTTPALADHDWHGHGDWHGNEGHEHAWRGGDDDRDWGGPVYSYSYGYYGYPAYGYPYAYPPPAPVYPAPPAAGLYFSFH